MEAHLEPKGEPKATEGWDCPCDPRGPSAGGAEGKWKDVLNRGAGAELRLTKGQRLLPGILQVREGQGLMSA